MAIHLELVTNAKCTLRVPPPTKQTVVDGKPQVAFDNMLGKQSHYSIGKEVKRFGKMLLKAFFKFCKPTLNQFSKINRLLALYASNVTSVMSSMQS